MPPGAIEELSTEMCFGLIADEETTTGFLLAALGEVESSSKNRNYYVVDQKTPYIVLIDYFNKLYSKKNIAILILSSVVAEKLEFHMQTKTKILPIIVQIPSKETLPSISNENLQRESLADVVADSKRK